MRRSARCATSVAPRDGAALTSARDVPLAPTEVRSSLRADRRACASHGRASTSIAACALGASSAARPRTLSCHYLEGVGRADVARLPADARRDQLRLGLVPDAAQAPPGRSGYATVAAALADHLRSRGPWTNASCAAIDTRDDRRRPRPAGRPRADGALRPGAARARRACSASARVLDVVAERRGSAERSRPRSPRHGDVRRPRLLQARADRPRATSRSPASPSSTTSTA